MPVPWTQLLRWAPEIITISRELIVRSRGKSASTDVARADDHTDLAGLAERIASLEDNERRQAELVERMAEQQAELARAVLTLHQRERWLIGAIAVLAVLLCWALLR